MANVEIKTVENSLGEILEKKLITSANLDLTNDNINFQCTNVIVRKDGVQVSSQQYGSISVGSAAGPVGMPGSAGSFTEAEVTTIKNAKNTFMNVVAGILNAKVEVTED